MSSMKGKDMQAVGKPRRQMVCGTDSDHCSVSCSKANFSQI